MGIPANSTNNAWYYGLFNSSDARIRKITSYRSPKTRADEFLFIAPLLQVILAAWCMWIGFASYKSFFAHNFNEQVAWWGALLLCVVIEFGKIKMGSYVFQKPFLEGTRFFQQKFDEVAVWGSALLFAGLTFWMSVVNSTAGAHSLSMMKGAQAHAEVFTPNTSDIDQQIQSAEARIKKAQVNTWKGKLSWESQKTVTRNTGTIEKLQDQRAKSIELQRADFKRRQDQNDTYSEKGANMLMAAGGYVEGLQGILLLLVAACMSIVSRVMKDEELKSIGNNGAFYRQANTNSSTPQNVNQSGTIGFYWNGYGNPQNNRDHKTVSQSKQAVSQFGGTNQVIGADHILKNCETAIRRDMPNFNRKDTRAESVYGRIAKVLDDCADAMVKPGFEPSKEVLLSFTRYINDVFKTLDDIGWPYQNDLVFKARMNTVFEALPVA
ncbi:MAG: hypothetical protein R3A50_04705 [Saprospiraceae bacterium]